KGITLDKQLDDTLYAWVDRDMLQLIVRNLINNAIKFSPRGAHIQVSVCASGADCLITVADTGMGITPAQQAALFSLKTRSTYGTDNERGIGLGLFLCKEYTLAQEGRLSFDSELGKGTKFYVSFPLAP